MTPVGRSLTGAIALLAWGGFTAGAVSGSLTTTVYVGRQYEVRDHEQPTKYFFNGDTRVAAVVGSLSANARLQRIRLWPGWNLVSSAVNAADLAGQIQRNQPDVVQSVLQWNAPSGDYSPLIPGQAVARGTVLWINARTRATLGIVGVYTDPAGSHATAEGGYLAGTGLEAWTPSLPTNCFGWTYDAESSQWHDEVAGDLGFLSDPPATIAPGEAIYVRADAPADLAIPDPALRIRYYHPDHLGSSSVVSDGNGALVEEAAFYPTGIPRTQFAPRQFEEPYQFSQKERDRESRLHYFEARYLAGGLSRFATADHKFANPDALAATEFGSFLWRPQTSNLYSYTRNNPVTFLDLSGEDARKRQPEPAPAEPEGSTLWLGEGSAPVIESEILSFSRKPRSKVQVGAEERQGDDAFTEFTITRTADASSTDIFNRAVGQGRFMEGVLTLRGSTAQGSRVYMKIKLTSVLITSYHLGGGQGASPTETFTISGKIEYLPIEQKPELSGEEQACYGNNPHPEQSRIPGALRLLPEPSRSVAPPEATGSVFDQWLWWKR